MALFSGIGNLSALAKSLPVISNQPQTVGGGGGILGSAISQLPPIQTQAQQPASPLLQGGIQGGIQQPQQRTSQLQTDQDIQQFDSDGFLQHMQQNPQMLNRIIELMRSQRFI